jgi:hypothetical protein
LKYQGRHGKQSETYDTIDTSLKSRDDWKESANSVFFEYLGKDVKGEKLSNLGKDTWEQLKWNKKLYGSPHMPDVDVITIRHRPLMEQVGALLEDVIAVAQLFDDRYKFFHCSFCRKHD